MFKHFTDEYRIYKSLSFGWSFEKLNIHMYVSYQHNLEKVVNKFGVYLQRNTR